MTKEERLDWLCRLRSFLVTVDMPKDWRTNFVQALSEEIEPVKCRECKYSAMIYSTNMVPVVGGFRAEGIDHIFCQCDKLGGIEMRWDDFCSRAERRCE